MAAASSVPGHSADTWRKDSQFPPQPGQLFPAVTAVPLAVTAVLVGSFKDVHQDLKDLNRGSMLQICCRFAALGAAKCPANKKVTRKEPIASEPA